MRGVQKRFTSKVGDIYISADGNRLTGISWEKMELTVLTDSHLQTEDGKTIHTAWQQLADYFDGKRHTFDIPFYLHGTPFQLSVWEALQTIPFGETVSYSDIATRIHHPKAVRAVGAANGRNPISVLIPCHRVIAKDGGIGGYAGGLAIKRQLLQLESKYSPV